MTILYIILSNKSSGKGGRRGVHGYGVCLPKQTLCVQKPCFPGRGWTSACRWKVVNEFFFLFCFHVQLLFFLVSLSSTSRVQMVTKVSPRSEPFCTTSGWTPLAPFSQPLNGVSPFTQKMLKDTSRTARSTSQLDTPRKQRAQAWFMGPRAQIPSAA